MEFQKIIHMKFQKMEKKKMEFVEFSLISPVPGSNLVPDFLILTLKKYCVRREHRIKTLKTICTRRRYDLVHMVPRFVRNTGLGQTNYFFEFVFVFTPN